jgi:hypothetical protein
MAANGLELIGSRPPSRLDSRIPPSSRSLGYALTDRQPTSGLRTGSAIDRSYRYVDASATGNTENYQNKPPFGVTQTIYSANRPRDDLMSRTYKKGGQLAAGKNADAMVSDRPSSRQQSARSIMSDRPPSGYRASQSSKVPRSAKRPPKVRQDSYVDETLFGPAPQEASFRAPWESTKSVSVNCRSGSTSSRPSSARPSSSRRSRISQPSYVDSSLFGDQLEPTSWRAPWEKPTSNTRPLLFDANDYHLTVEHDNIKTVNEYRSRTKNLVRASSHGNISQKAPWR